MESSSQVNPNYGSKEWFEQKFADVDQWGDHWGHRFRASQQVRLETAADCVKSKLSNTSSFKVLDIGCGLGEFISILKNKHPQHHYFGCDLSENAIHHDQKAFPDSVFQVNALPELIYSSSFFNFISVLEVTSYLSPADRSRSIAEIHRCLLPGGTILFSGTIHAGEKYFTKKEILKFISDHFKVLSVVYHCSWPYTVFERGLYGFVTLGRIYQSRDFGRLRFLTENTKVRKILELGFVAAMVRVLYFLFGGLALKILSSKSLFRRFAQVSQYLFGDRAQTNMMVVAEKSIS